MIEIVWEFSVKPDAQSQFELVYGPGGAWSRLFGQSPGFRGTTMLQDTQNPRRYLIFDLWETAVQHEQALATDAYARLNTDLKEWIESKTELGIFRIRAEATVRPRGKASRKSPRSSR